ncbi:uncharacterized protein DUF4190 [Homoserinimonas aerilata]|uniref:Uncharacterized protein DUF4190 n=1 Tax=Homoserinimonas aerilata TaxID=1162970 RepID=A0A542YFB8_9MICO|nr:DUF4190 domain-containing protein [Homoserinimonas aerilata]TQL46783.1 uncharacterized protein DUF4190 [Homoserinimonas aerilata]
MSDPALNQPAGQPQPVYFVQAPPRGLSVTSMVLGLASILFGFTFLVPLGALIFGIVGLKKEPAGRGMAITGIVIGALFMLFWVLLGGVILAAIGGLIGLAGTTSYTG